MTSISKPQYSFESPLRQSFSLPSDVLTHLLNNCSSPELLLKLQKTCKYFLLKKKIIVVNKKAYSHYTHLAFIESKYAYYRKLGGPFQYWYVDTLEIFDLNFVRITKYLKNIYRCDLRRLIIDDVIIKFKEINLLLNDKRIEELILWHVSMRHEDVTPVNINSIWKQCPNLRMLRYCNRCETFSSKTFINLNQLHFNDKLKEIMLFFPTIEDKLDPDIVCEYFKNVLILDAELKLYFLRNIPEMEFNIFKSAVESIKGDRLANLVIDYYVERPEF